MKLGWYENYYQGVNNNLNIYDSFLTEIEIATREEVEKTGTSIEINNNGTERIYPTVEFDNFFASADTIIISGEVDIKITEELDVNNLYLDFKNQIYEADNVNIIDKIEFVNDERFYIEANKVNEIQLSPSEGTIKYYKYPDLSRERFVQDFNVSVDFRYSENNERLLDYEVTFRLGRYKTSDRTIIRDIKKGKKFRIKIIDRDIENYESNKSYLLDCSITDWEYSFSEQGDIIINNLTGESKDLIKDGVLVTVSRMGIAGEEENI